MSSDKIITLVAFAFYMILMILIGVFYSRKTKNNEDYFLGGRNLGGWTAALSAQASDMSGWLLMGLPGAIYLSGTGEIWTAIGLLIGTILNWYLVSSRLRKYTIVSGNSLTIPSFFENGGFKAVCTTDFIQGMLMLVAILAVPIIAYGTMTWDGGFASSLSKNGVSSPENYINLFKTPDGENTSTISIISGLAWGLGYFGMPHIIIRFMAIKNEREVKKSRKIAIAWVILSLAAACFVGFVARGYLNTQLDGNNSETAFIRLIQQMFSGNFALVFIGGIFLCGILAAIMSTADSQLLVTSSAISEDVYKGIFKRKTAKDEKTEKKALMIGRIAVLVIAVIAFIIALDPNSSVMKLVKDAWGGFGAAFGPVVLLALFWKRSNLAGAISGMITGTVFVLFWSYIPLIQNTDLTKFNGADMITLYDSTGLYSLAIAFPLALIVNIVVSLITKKPSEEITKEFESVKTIEI